MTDVAWRVEQAWRLLGADPTTADALTRADVLWLARLLPEADDADREAAQAGPVQPPPGPAPPGTTPEHPAATGTVGTPASARPEADKEISLFTQQPGDDNEPQLHARRVPVPAADALPGRIDFDRALRPFLRRRPSRVRRMVDAEATAEASAQAGADALLAAAPGERAVPALVPVLRPVPERWFDMVLLAEQDDTMRVFDDTLKELRQLLGRHGAFRRVGLWRWSVRDGAVRVQTASGMPCAPRAMLQGQHPQLVWVLTHGASTQWDASELRAFVRSLADRAVVAILQMLPETAWGATALGESQERVRSRERGATNGQLLTQDLWEGTWTRDGASGVVPMLQLRHDAVARWARFVMSPRSLVHAAVLVAASDAAPPQSGAPPVPAVAGKDAHAAIREQVLRFRAVASPPAFALLRLLSGAWITLPVMRLLQQSLPGSRTALAPMAEVLLSGLLRRTSAADAKTEELTFDFAPSVRDWLSGSLSGTEQRALDSAMAESKEAIRRFVEEKTGRKLASFSALLLDEEGTELLPKSARSFVEVSRQLRSLRGAPVPPPAPVAVQHEPEPAPLPQPRTVRRLRILHLSDLHIGSEKPIGAWRERPFMGEAWRQYLRDIQAESAIDLVCLTGDVAHAGRAEEYDQARHFVFELMDTLQLGMDRFFVVPGNHDIDRSVNPEALHQARHALTSPDLAPAQLLQQMTARQTSFRGWLKTIARDSLLPAHGSHGPLGYRIELQVGLDAPLSIVGLDSAWLSDHDSGSDALRVASQQLDRLLPPDGVPGCSIALMHHPLDAMADGAAVDHKLAQAGVSLLLNGHRHGPQVPRWDRTAGGIEVSSAGGLYELDGVPASFHVLDLDLYANNEDHPAHIRPKVFSPRVWSTAGHWQKAGDAGLEEADAALDKEAVGWPPFAEAPTPFSKQIFIGRRSELDQISKALMPAEGQRPLSVALVGEGGIGKTALADQFLVRHWLPIMGMAHSSGPFESFVRIQLSGTDIRDAQELGQSIAKRLQVEYSHHALWSPLRAELQARPRLLMFDDVYTAAQAAALDELATHLSGCAILATSRHLIGSRDWTTIRLAPLSVHEATELLLGLTVSRADGAALTQVEAEELASIVGYLPRDLRAAAHRWSEGITPEQMRDGNSTRNAKATPDDGLPVPHDAEQPIGKDEAELQRGPSPSQGSTRNVLVSAVGSEFGELREGLWRWLQQLGMHVRGHEDAPASGMPTLLRIDDRVRACDVVIHLAGDACGADARAAGVAALTERYPDFVARIPGLRKHLAQGGEPLPYQQWEAWLALYHGKQLVVARPSPDARPSPKHAPNESQMARQRQHLTRLQPYRRIYTDLVFSSMADLEARLLASRLLNGPDQPESSNVEGRTVPSAAPPLKIFLSYTAADAEAVYELHRRLEADGYAPRFNEVDVLPGQDWQAQTTQALHEADIVLVCLSARSLAKPGFAEQEIHMALEVAATQPEGSIYLIPVRLEPCDVPEFLAGWHWVDYFSGGGYQRLLRSLQSKQAERRSSPPAVVPTANPFAPPLPRRRSIFISYAREDMKAVRKLAQRLETLGFDCVWFDVFQAGNDATATQRIAAAMHACDHFMPVLSTTADKRPTGRYWDEWRWAIDRAKEITGHYLLPVGIDKRPPDRMGYFRIFKDTTAGLVAGNLLHARAGDFNSEAVAELSKLLRGKPAAVPLPPADGAPSKLGRYEILQPLSKSWGGFVYEAHDPTFDRPVAIKTMRLDQISAAEAEEYESRFRAEARAGGRLKHPNILDVYDAGRDGNTIFVVMELAQGGDLKQLLDDSTQLSFQRSMAIMQELLSAMSCAHENGIIHRDIKPANVLLDSKGGVKLADFGIAHLLDSTAADSTTDAIVGTPRYMSPEQFQGLQIDHRSDIFSAGVVLYQMLTGARPFTGQSEFAIMQAIMKETPVPPSSLSPDLPSGIDGIVAKALAKDRDHRYASAADFALALREVQTGQASR